MCDLNLFPHSPIERVILKTTHSITLGFWSPDWRASVVLEAPRYRSTFKYFEGNIVIWGISSRFRRDYFTYPWYYIYAHRYWYICTLALLYMHIGTAIYEHQFCYIYTSIFLPDFADIILHTRCIIYICTRCCYICHFNLLERHIYIHVWISSNCVY